MAKPMNSFLTQSAAVGIITLVAMFPTPQRLREAITTPPSQITSPISEPASVVIDSNVYDDETITVEAPFPLDCATHTTESNDLGQCAMQLAAYLANTEAPKPENAAFQPISPPDPYIEQARRALIELCRLRWSMKDPLPDPQMSQACADLG
jgi:hypothetical protein